jgi:hypothetical protein
MIKNNRSVPARIRPRATVHRRGGLPRVVGRKAGWASACRPGPTVERPPCPRGLRAHRARWRRGHYARDGAVARSPTARWWLAGGKVLLASSWGPPGGCRARRGLVGLTEGGGHLRGGVAARCGGAQQGPHRREGQRRCRLAPRAAGEDERRVGGPS